MKECPELIQFGVNAKETDRYRKIKSRFGDVADQEVYANLQAYEHEFLQDQPLSRPHHYFHFRNELYSQPIDNELFRIKAQIDGREREGRTLLGFSKFEKAIAESKKDDEVFLWYSPAGKAGNIPPFDQIYFDSGRLYVCFKQTSNQSRHFDIKIDESRFPITEFLQFFSQDEKRLDEFLTEPIAPQITTNEFFYIVDSFMRSMNIQNRVVYTSQRNSAHAKEHTFYSIFSTLKKNAGQPLEEEDKTNKEARVDADNIVELYKERIYRYAQANGGQITLYGCSATKTVSIDSLFETNFIDQLTQKPVENIYSTISRTGIRSESNVVKPTGEKIVTCPSCGAEVRFNADKAISEGKLACSCGNSVNNTCDVEAIAAAARSA